MREWMRARVAREGGTLVVAHVLSRISENNALANALIYPRYLQQELGLMGREVLITGLSAKPEDAQESTRYLLQRTDLYEVIGDVAASQHLLSPQAFHQTISRTMFQ